MSPVTEYFENVFKQGKGLLAEKSARVGTNNVNVFSINLVRREILPYRVGKLLVYFASGSILVNLFVLFVLIATVFGTYLKAEHLEQILKGKFPAIVDVERLKPEMKELQKEVLGCLSRLNSVIGLEKENFRAADKLAGLTRTMPGRTWITQLSGDRSNGTVTIEASYLIKPDSPYQLPTKQWIETLQKDPDFGSGLKHVELKKSSQKTQGKSEVYSFQLLAEWTKNEAGKK